MHQLPFSGRRYVTGIPGAKDVGCPHQRRPHERLPEPDLSVVPSWPPPLPLVSRQDLRVSPSRPRRERRPGGSPATFLAKSEPPPTDARPSDSRPRPRAACRSRIAPRPSTPPTPTPPRCCPRWPAPARFVPEPEGEARHRGGDSTWGKYTDIGYGVLRGLELLEDEARVQREQVCKCLLPSLRERSRRNRRYELLKESLRDAA